MHEQWSPSLWFFELELGKVKKKKQAFIYSLLSKLTRRESGASQCHAPAYVSNVVDPPPWQGATVLPHLPPPVVSMPFPVLGGNEFPFAYANSRWDSDTTKKF